MFECLQFSQGYDVTVAGSVPHCLLTSCIIIIKPENITLLHLKCSLTNHDEVNPKSGHFASKYMIKDISMIVGHMVCE